jgi:hypothetical protein
MEALKSNTSGFVGNPILLSLTGLGRVHDQGLRELLPLTSSGMQCFT